MINEDQLTEIIEDAVILDPNSEHYGIKYTEAVERGLIIPSMRNASLPQVFKVYDNISL